MTTLNKLERKAKEFDEINNEGAEGYNPYRQQIAEILETADTDNITIDGKIDALQKKLLETAGDTAHISAEIRTLKEQLQTEIKNIWTVETTKKRRAEWNEFIKSLAPRAGQKLSTAAVCKIMQKQDEQGWTKEELKEAIKRHNL